MDFIEKLTGLSPDGGDGSTELLFVTASLANSRPGVGRLTTAKADASTSVRQPASCTS